MGANQVQGVHGRSRAGTSSTRLVQGSYNDWEVGMRQLQEL